MDGMAPVTPPLHRYAVTPLRRVLVTYQQRQGGVRLDGPGGVRALEG
jgi:hypothetical protein